MMESTTTETPVLRLATDLEPRPKVVPSTAKFNAQAQQSSQPQHYQIPLRVLTYSPQNGQEGTTFTVTLQLAQPLELRVAFGHYIVDTKQLNMTGGTTLAAVVPNFDLTESTNTKVPLYVMVLNESENVVGSLHFGYFTYWDPTAKNERKRGLSASDAPGIKRIHTTGHNIHAKEEEANITPTSFQLYQQQSSSTNPYVGLTPAQARTVQAHQRYQALQMQQRDYYNEGDDVATTRSTQVIPPYYQQQHSTPSSYGYDPALGTNSTGLAGMGIGNLASEEMSPTPMTSPSGPATNYTAQPSLFGALVHKANLKVSANMEDMALGWTDEEFSNRRRLVQFWRNQDGNDIHCSFAPMTGTTRSPTSIIVSCIFWQEKNECFITSVDCIYLLESLIGVRFTVEEKNRIRRNLEGFRPHTVSKCKAESAEFFKLIMGFPNPKPRNIEKDVKVFQWKVLSHALRKIISKYTASYSSTASVNIDSVIAPYPGSHAALVPGASIPSPYGYDNTGAIQTSIGSHAPSSLALESTVMSQSSQRYGNTPSPHHIVPSHTAVRSNSTSPMQSRSSYTQAALQPHFDVATQHLEYGSSHHLGHHRTPSNTILDSAHLSHPSMSPHSVTADVSHDPHQLQPYPPSTASTYTSSLQQISPTPVYSHYPYSAPYSHGLHYGDGGSASEVDVQVTKEEPYNVSRQPTPQRNVTSMGDEYHNGGWGTGPADENDARKAYGSSSTLYAYNGDDTHIHAQAHGRSGRLDEDEDSEGNAKDPDEYVVGQVEE